MPFKLNPHAECERESHLFNRNKTIFLTGGYVEGRIPADRWQMAVEVMQFHAWSDACLPESKCKTGIIPPLLTFSVNMCHFLFLFFGHSSLRPGYCLCETLTFARLMQIIFVMELARLSEAFRSSSLSSWAHLHLLPGVNTLNCMAVIGRSNRKQM